MKFSKIWKIPLSSIWTNRKKRAENSREGVQWKFEASMHEYEIRILRADRSTTAVMNVMHLDDNAAIMASERMAGATPFEVWRGLNCIYGGYLTEPTPVAVSSAGSLAS